MSTKEIQRGMWWKETPISELKDKEHPCKKCASWWFFRYPFKDKRKCMECKALSKMPIDK